MVSDSDRAQYRSQEPERAARQARFGRLPERIRPEDMVQEVPAADPDPARDTYNPDEWMVRYAL